MKEVVKYVPTQINGEQDPILVNGDQVSIEKMVQAKFNVVISKFLFFQVGMFVIGRV